MDDLRPDAVDPNESGEDGEDEGETPAEKRLRLARLYLESVKDGLGAFLVSRLRSCFSSVHLGLRARWVE